MTQAKTPSGPKNLKDAAGKNSSPQAIATQPEIYTNEADISSNPDLELNNKLPSIQRTIQTLQQSNGQHQRQAIFRSIERKYGNTYAAQVAASFQKPTNFEPGNSPAKGVHVPLARATIQRQVAEIDEVKDKVENATGYDLTSVQVTPNSSLAANSGVEAVTVGHEIHLAPGHAPGSPHGDHVLAHEMAHTVQQSTAQTSDIDHDNRRADLEQQADQTAAQALSALSPAKVPATSSPKFQPLQAVSRPVAQAFDPRYHRKALVEGLKDSSFSNEEIGQMYAANWERDFSQAHPALGAIVLDWKAIKLAIADKKPDPEVNQKIEAFNGTVNDLLDQVMSPKGLLDLKDGKLALKNGKSYEGYNYFEHMDNPVNSEAQKNLDKPTRDELLQTPKGEHIPQYLVDSREYIKAQLFNATSAFRPDMSKDSTTAKVAANFDERQKKLKEQFKAQTQADEAQNNKVIPGSVSAKEVIGAETANQVKDLRAKTPSNLLELALPPGEAMPIKGPVFNEEVDRRFWKKTGYKVGQRLDPKLAEDAPYVPQWLKLRDEVRAERTSYNQVLATINAAKKAVAFQNQGGGTAVMDKPPGVITAPKPTGQWNDKVAQSMGRASHALEDYFAHSTFVEMAIGRPKNMPEDQQYLISGKKDDPNDLRTGTFGAKDELHSLAHKVRGVADEIDSEMPLIKRVAGRTTKNPSAGEVNVGSDKPPTPEHTSPSDYFKAGWTALKAAGRIAGNAALGAINGGVPGFLGGLQDGVKSALKKDIATPRGVNMLRMVAEYLEDDSRAKADPLNSHTALAKDQPGHDDSPLDRLRTAKFELANDLATAADRMILGAMHQVFEAASPEQADALLNKVFDLLNQMIMPPSPEHPLSGVIQPHLDKAKDALDKWWADQSQKKK